MRAAGIFSVRREAPAVFACQARGCVDFAMQALTSKMTYCLSPANGGMTALYQEKASHRADEDVEIDSAESTYLRTVGLMATILHVSVSKARGSQADLAHHIDIKNIAYQLRGGSGDDARKRRQRSYDEHAGQQKEIGMEANGANMGIVPFYRPCISLFSYLPLRSHVRDSNRI